MHRGFAATAEAPNATDVDSRATLLLEEIHRVRQSYADNDIIASNVLQHVEQTFDADNYVRALETEIDQLLRSQAMTKRHRNPINSLESQNNVTHCRACKSPCKWTPYCAQVQEQTEEDDHPIKKRQAPEKARGSRD